MINRPIAVAVVQLMNEALALDPIAVGKLANFRTPCNGALAGHESIQAGRYPDPGGPTTVGLLGILNGIAGADEATLGAVAAIVEDDGSVIGFRVLEERAAP